MKTKQEIRNTLSSVIKSLKKDIGKMAVEDIYHELGYIRALYFTLDKISGKGLELIEHIVEQEIWCMICRMVGLVLRVAMNILKTL